MIKFRLKNYNEFRYWWIRWHDYISIMINEFPILLVRRYDWLDKNESTWLITFIGFSMSRIVKDK